MDFLDSMPCKRNCSDAVTAVNHSFGTIADLLANVSFALLIVYKLRIKNEEAEDAHAILFRQLFYLSGVILAVRNACRVLLWFVLITSSGMKSVQQTMVVMVLFASATAVAYVNSFPITAVLMFSFTAAVQRLLLTYKSEYAHYFTGHPMYIVIMLNWAFSAHYFYVIKNETTSFLNLWHFTTSPLSVIYRMVLFTCTVTSCAIYYHFYRLISTFTDQYEFHRIHLLYQFVPIHSLLTVYSLIQLILTVLDELDFDYELVTGLSVHFETFITPLIPTVVALSYITSRENIRAVLLAVLGPIWQEMSG